MNSEQSCKEKTRMIEINGKKYEVLEMLPQNLPARCQARYLATSEGKKLAIKRDGIWIWWAARDRIVSARGAQTR